MNEREDSEIGSIRIDSGTLVIFDPVNISKEKFQEGFENSDNHIDLGHTEITHKSIHENMGLFVKVGHGNKGKYSVHARIRTKKNNEKIVEKIWIDFFNDL